MDSKYFIKENIISKERMVDVFEIGDFVSDGIYLSDKRGVVIYVNKSYSRITGIQDDEIVGKHMQSILDEKYLTGEYVLLVVESSNQEIIKSTTNNKEFCITKKPIAICNMVLEHKKEISVMGILGVSEKGKQIIFEGKPYFNNQGELTHVLTVIIEITELTKLKEKLEYIEEKSREYINRLESLRNNQVEEELIGKDPSTEKIRQLINRVAKIDATVLITGETGVGKEVVAKEIYKKSNRNAGPYIKVNCAAIPENLLESEMFGYEKGSFTGALRKEKLGYFELAQGGTLLLDEIGEMPVKLQSKLLRVIQEREITRIGGTKPIRIDVRIIAATNQNIEEQIKNGTFREDLYYRLNVIPIQIPPLRERKADIAILAHKFLVKFTEKYNRNKEFEITAIDALERYNWDGNVRELENTVERLVILGNETSINGNDIINILGKNKFSCNVIDNDNITLKEATDILEKNIIEKALRKYKSSRKAAKVLGVTQPTILRKAKALGIKDW